MWLWLNNFHNRLNMFVKRLVFVFFVTLTMMAEVVMSEWAMAVVLEIFLILMYLKSSEVGETLRFDAEYDR